MEHEIAYSDVMNMEKLIYQSPKKHKIIGAKNYLTENGASITSIKLYIHVEWSLIDMKTYNGSVEKRERRDTIDVPIEEFNETLNDAQTFEVYVDETVEDKALDLIEKYTEDTFFDDCVYRSSDYDKTFEMYLLLNKNNIPCEDIVTIFDEYSNGQEYLLFIKNPEYRESASDILSKNAYIEPDSHNKIKNENSVMEYQNNEENKLLKYLPIIIIIGALLIPINNEPNIVGIIKKIIEYLNN